MNEKLGFDFTAKTYVMGILNITPDSFSGDGLLGEQEWINQAVEQGIRFAEEGAHILDIGGESTRPGADTVGASEEIERVVPVIEALAARVDLPLSVDTYKANVAAAALDAGAHIVNDVWGLKMDQGMADMCAQHNVPVIVMHNRSHPHNAVQEDRLGGRFLGTEYDDLLADIAHELQQSIDIAKSAGISDNHIIIDPGIGFGKSVEQNLTLLNQLDKLKTLGYPILLGTSNKSLIGYTLDVPPDERVEGTAATVTIGIERGADIIRVHQVREMSRVARMTDAIVRG
jgi:dihydropteroate synthase